MSMQSYNVQEYGLVLTEDEALNFARTYIKLEHPEITDSDDWDHWEVIDYCNFDTLSQFSGEATKLDTNGTGNCYDTIYYRHETLFYFTINNYPNLFYPAYKNYDELLNEFKTKYSKYLPKDFEYENHIRIIQGTYWG